MEADRKVLLRGTYSFQYQAQCDLLYWIKGNYNWVFPYVVIASYREYLIFSRRFTKFVTIHKRTHDLTYTYRTTNRRRIYSTEQYSKAQKHENVLIRNIKNVA
jgi:hypothetical protein